MTITSKLIRAAVAAALAGTFALQAQTITETTEPVTAGEVTIDPDANYRPLDRIVAVVNNDVITEFELQNRVRQVAVNLRRQNIELPPMPQLRAQVLDRLITEKAMQQRAREIGVRVDEQMVTASIEQIARNNKLTTDELRSRLRDEGVSWSAFRSQIRCASGKLTPRSTFRKAKWTRISPNRRALRVATRWNTAWSISCCPCPPTALKARKGAK